MMTGRELALGSHDKLRDDYLEFLLFFPRFLFFFTPQVLGTLDFAAVVPRHRFER